MVKKITREDAEFIFNRKMPIVQRVMCKNVLIDGPEGGGCFIFQSRVKTFWFCLMFLPIALCQFIYCLWDGGIKEFQFMTGNDRIVEFRREYFSSNEESLYQRMLKVWEKA